MSLNRRTQDILEWSKVPYRIVKHPSASTASATAAASHVSGWEFAKVVVVEPDARHPMMVVLPAARHLDLDALRDIAAERHLRLATEVECHRLFPDCEPGAMPPFGNAYGMPVYLDACLARTGEIVFNAGTHTEAVRMRFADFVRLAHPVIAEFCR